MQTLTFTNKPTVELELNEDEALELLQQLSIALRVKTQTGAFFTMPVINVRDQEKAKGVNGTAAAAVFAVTLNKE